MTPLLALAVAAFTGNDACRPCHGDIVRSYEATAMARSTGPVRNDIPPGQFWHAASNTEFTVMRDGRVSIRRGAQTEQQQIDFVIGSGAAGSSFLILRDRYLFQAPIAWYAQKHRWDASPGYQDDSTMAWDRPVDPSCLLCHASQLTHIYGTVNRYAGQPYRQAGVGCERCHGPGSEHVQGKGRMTVPPQLDAERRDDVCRQCHLMGEARIERAGRRFAEYRPGDRLGDYVAYFVPDDPGGPALRTTSHIEKLAASRCKQASGEKMWCGTCHDVHTTPPDPVSWYRGKCGTCHELTAQGQAQCRRGGNCISCHMPKSRATDAGHGAFTDHSIRRVPDTRRADKAKSWRLRPFSAADAGDRELALAYAQVYQRSHDERQKQEAVRLANESLRK